MKVFKFGGASVKDATAVKNVAHVLEPFRNEPLLVVVSAMGKMTNALEKLATAYFNSSSEKYQFYREIKEFHEQIIADLLKDDLYPAYNDIQNLFIELECELELEPETDFNQVYDQIVSYGEILSTRIVSTFLNQNGVSNRWMDARNFISTDTNYRDANIDWSTTTKLISKKLKPIVQKQLVVSQGFIGKNKDNFTVTLGREGSDYSAAIFAYGLDAESLTIWKDVDGVMNADPKTFPQAIKITEISYPRAIEMAYYGATIIHPKTIQPLQHKQIPLFVKSFVNPSAQGTMVGIEPNKEETTPAYIFKANQVLLSFGSKDFSFIVEDGLSKIFEGFAKHHVKVNLMQNSAISFSVAADADNEKIKSLSDELEPVFTLTIEPHVELLTISQFQADETYHEMLKGRQIILEQRTSHTVQYVLKAK